MRVCVYVYDRSEWEEAFAFWAVLLCLCVLSCVSAWTSMVLDYLHAHLATSPGRQLQQRGGVGAAAAHCPCPQSWSPVWLEAIHLESWLKCRLSPPSPSTWRWAGSHLPFQLTLRQHRVTKVKADSGLKSGWREDDNGGTWAAQVRPGPQPGTSLLSLRAVSSDPMFENISWCLRNVSGSHDVPVRTGLPFSCSAMGGWVSHDASPTFLWFHSAFPYI